MGGNHSRLGRQPQARANLTAIRNTLRRPQARNIAQQQTAPFGNRTEQITNEFVRLLDMPWAVHISSGGLMRKARNSYLETPQNTADLPENEREAIWNELARRLLAAVRVEANTRGPKAIPREIESIQHVVENVIQQATKNYPEAFAGRLPAKELGRKRLVNDVARNARTRNTWKEVEQTVQGYAAQGAASRQRPAAAAPRAPMAATAAPARSNGRSNGRSSSSGGGGGSGDGLFWLSESIGGSTGGSTGGGDCFIS